MRLTQKMIEGLHWFERFGPAHLFDADAPSRVIRRRLAEAGFIEEADVIVDRGLTFQRVQLSRAGRAALAFQKGRTI